MTDPTEWIKNLLSDEDIAALESTARRIVDADTTIYEMSIMMRQSDMIDAVQAGFAMQEGDPDAWTVGVSLLMALLSTMREALDSDGVNYID